MKCLRDRHLSYKLVPLLQEAFPGTAHVSTRGLDTADDEVIWDAAKRDGFVIVSKDDDFQVLSFTRGHPPKVVWLRSGNGPTRDVLDLLLRARSIIEDFLADDERSLLVLP